VNLKKRAIFKDEFKTIPAAGVVAAMLMSNIIQL